MNTVLFQKLDSLIHNPVHLRQRLQSHPPHLASPSSVYKPRDQDPRFNTITFSLTLSPFERCLHKHRVSPAHSEE